MGTEFQQTRAPSSAQAAGVVRPTPGKATLTEAAADGRSRPRLTPDQRSMLAMEYIGRVNAALTSYVTALTDLRVERFVENETEIPAVVNILIGVIAGTASFAIQGAIKALISGGAKEIVAEAGIAAHAASAFEGLGEHELEYVVGGAIDHAREASKPAAIEALTGDAANAKRGSLSYIDQLRDNSIVEFQKLREDPIERASDAQLLTLFAAFDGARQTVTMYRERLDAQLKRYMKSHAKEIGRDGANRETSVAWLVRADGRRDLMYMRRSIPIARALQLGDSNQATTGEHALSQADRVTSQRAFGRGSLVQADPSPDDGFVGFVEPEFKQAALQRQEATWLAEPAVYRLDYSVMPPRLARSES